MQTESISQQLSDISEKVDRSERLSFEDGVRLFESNDLIAIGAMANKVRERVNGDLT
jgi:aminodeoxyfutalosine synthase